MDAWTKRAIVYENRIRENSENKSKENAILSAGRLSLESSTYDDPVQQGVRMKNPH